jgi:glycerol-3-phosphate dehydrogenase
MIKRSDLLNKIKDTKQFDVVIIGGGAVGLGAGLDASSRELKTLVIEKYDFAKGTSSRSTKLLHGGVRYLAQLHFNLVKDSLREKERLYNNAPHLTKDCEFIIPCYKYFDMLFYRAGLFLYDVLAGFPKGHTSGFLSKAALIKKYPNIKQQGLVGGIVYHDGIFDDARLALSLSRSIIALKSFAINYCEAIDFIKENGKIVGVVVKDRLSGEEFTVSSSCVLNATGIFSDEIRNIDQPNSPAIVQQAQGVHIVVDKKHFNSAESLLIPKTDDGRVLFTVPWHGEVLVGTTDTKVEESKIEPVAFKEEINFIIGNINKYLEKPITEKDILSIYAGIRPLIKQDSSNTSAISREEKMVLSQSNLVSVIGGKWTSYRRMSEKVVDFLIANKLVKAGKSNTANLQLHGFLKREYVEILDDHIRQYGSDLKILKTLEGNEEKIHPKMPFTKAQVLYALRYEQAQTVDDVLARRTRALFLNAKYAKEAAQTVAEIMAKELGKNQAWIKEQVAYFEDVAKNYIVG